MEPIISLRRVVLWAAGPALLLLFPLVAMQFTEEVNWTGFDFAVAGTVLTGAGVAYALATGWTRNTRVRAAIGLPILGLVLLFWAWAVN